MSRCLLPISLVWVRLRVRVTWVRVRVRVRVMWVRVRVRVGWVRVRVRVRVLKASQTSRISNSHVSPRICSQVMASPDLNMELPLSHPTRLYSCRLSCRRHPAPDHALPSLC